MHAVPQQTPWAQMALLHSVPLEQTAPFGLSPHDPEMQEAGIAQSLSVAQVALQALQLGGKGDRIADRDKRLGLGAIRDADIDPQLV